MTRIPKNCPFCGNSELETQGGIEITRYYKNGVFMNESRAPIPRHLICMSMKCGGDIISDSISEWDDMSIGSKKSLKQKGDVEK